MEHEFLTKHEAAELLRKAPATIDSMRRRGVLQYGVHWFRPRGSFPLFDRQALLAWIRADAMPPAPVGPRRRGPTFNVALLGDIDR